MVMIRNIYLELDLNSHILTDSLPEHNSVLAKLYSIENPILEKEILSEVGRVDAAISFSSPRRGVVDSDHWLSALDSDFARARPHLCNWICSRLDDIFA